MTAIKQSLEDSKVALRQYEWVETTIISVKGEEKSRTHQRCYYGADGKIQKIGWSSRPNRKALAVVAIVAVTDFASASSSGRPSR